MKSGMSFGLRERTALMSCMLHRLSSYLDMGLKWPIYTRTEGKTTGFQLWLSQSCCCPVVLFLLFGPWICSYYFFSWCCPGRYEIWPAFLTHVNLCDGSLWGLVRRTRCQLGNANIHHNKTDANNHVNHTGIWCARFGDIRLLFSSSTFILHHKKTGIKITMLCVSPCWALVRHDVQIQKLKILSCQKQWNLWYVWLRNWITQWSTNSLPFMLYSVFQDRLWFRDLWSCGDVAESR